MGLLTRLSVSLNTALDIIKDGPSSESLHVNQPLDWDAVHAAILTEMERRGMEHVEKGSEHSGHHGHKGIPGSRGGSLPSASPGVVASWYSPPVLDDGLIDSLDEFDIGGATWVAEQMGYSPEWQAFQRDVQRWTMQADADAKYEIEGWIRERPHLRALTLYDDWSSEYTKDAIAGRSYPSFREWLDVPQTLYRSGGQSEVFMSFARSKRVAMDATNSTEAWWIQIPPRSWFASAGTGAGEVWVASDAIEQLGENY